MDKPKVQENETEEKQEKPPIFKKVLLGAFTIIVILMLIFYFMTTPLMQGIIIGLFESSTVDRNAADIGQGKMLFFENNTHDLLMGIYDRNPEREFKVCLMGEINDGNYFVNEVFEPKMIYQDADKVVAEPCPDETLVSLHSHPFRQCLPSETDLRNFEALKKVNNNTLMAVMCERGRFNFYR